MRSPHLFHLGQLPDLSIPCLTTVIEKGLSISRDPVVHSAGGSADSSADWVASENGRQRRCCLRVFKVTLSTPTIPHKVSPLTVTMILPCFRIQGVPQHSLSHSRTSSYRSCLESVSPTHDHSRIVFSILASCALK
jgi:hypothetical protein